MNHPLDGARLKIVRAQEHLDSLKAEIGMYLKEHTHDIVIDKETNLTTVVVITEPPLRLSTIIGDCVTNARAALDYIIWQLAKHHFDPPINLTSGKDKRLIAFPIHVTGKTDDYTRHVDRLAERLKATPLLDVPTFAAKAIHDSQTQGGLDVLGWLHHLVNTDKHKMPLLTLTAIDTFEVVLGYGPAHHTIVRSESDSGSGHTINAGLSGAFNATYRGSHTQRVTVESGKVKVDVQPTLRVSLQDSAMPHKPVDLTLEQIVETVTNIIPRFNRFF
jgi:hypothetical protein